MFRAGGALYPGWHVCWGSDLDGGVCQAGAGGVYLLPGANLGEQSVARALCCSGAVSQQSLPARPRAPGLSGHPPSCRAALVTPEEVLPVLASATVFVVKGPACSAGSRKWVNFSLGSSAAMCLFFHNV